MGVCKQNRFLERKFLNNEVFEMAEKEFNERFWEIPGHPQNVPVHTTSENMDLFYMNMAKLASFRSKCASRGIGAVLVKDDNIISWGCNGAPAKIDLCQDVSAVCPRQEANYKSGEGLHICPAQHAERNAILHAAKHGISTNGATLYCYCGLPCHECWKAIITAGVQRVVYVTKEASAQFEKKDDGYLVSYDKEGHLIRYDDLSVVFAHQSGVDLTAYTEEAIESYYDRKGR